MVPAERLLARGERTIEHRLGLGLPALRKMERGEVVQALGDVGMLRAVHPLADGQRAGVMRSASAGRA